MSNVEDKDLGLKRIYAVAKKSAREIQAGIFIRKILDYAFVIESRFHFLRDGTAAADPAVEKKLDEIHDILAKGKGNLRAAQLGAGEVVANGIRQSIIDQKLIKSGDMLASVTVKEKDVK